MKKNIKSLLYLSAVGVLSLSTACSDTYEQFTVDGKDPYSVNKVYVYQPDETFAQLNYKANGDFINQIGDFIKVMPIRTTKAAPQDLNVTIEIDPTLVDEYNEANGTNYTLLKSAKIVNPTIVIEKGKYISEDTIKVRFTDVSELQGEISDFIVPIKISDSGSKDVQVSKSSRIFLTFSAELEYNYFSMVQASQYYQVMYHYQTGLPTNALSTLDVTSYIQSTFETFEDVDVQLRINNDLIASSSYPSYNPVPQVRLKEEKVKMEKGTRTARFSLEFPDQMASLKSGTYYLIPIEIVSVNGLGNELGNPKVAYVRLTYGTYTPTQISFYYSTYEAVTSYFLTVIDGQAENPISELNTKTRLYADANIAASPLTAVLKINNDLIASYNSTNGTKCVAAPEGSVVLTKDRITVGNGINGYYSADTLKLSFPDKMASMQAGNTYLIPVEIIDVVDGDGVVRTSPSASYPTVIYVTITAAGPSDISQVFSAEEIGGNPIDRSNLTAYHFAKTSPNTKSDITSIVKGTGTYSLISSPTTRVIEVDLGDTHTIRGFSMNYFSASYGLKSFNLQVSKDGTSWDDLGDTLPFSAEMIHYVKIRNSAECRYIRVTPLAAQGSWLYIGSSSAATNPGWNFYE